ncbi:MAG: class I SAM-dependent methyltransferase [Desulfovibrionaceae bacterium]
MKPAPLTPLARLEAAETIALYPAASGAAHFLSFLRARAPHLLGRIAALGDRDPNKQGLTQEGYRVLAPEAFAALRPDCVVACSFPVLAAVRGLMGEAADRVVLHDEIQEYLDWEAERSVLARRTAEAAPDLSGLAGLSRCMHAMPLGPGRYAPADKGALTYRLLDMIRLDERMDGASVLDLGAAEGFYGFECEARGASRVLALESFGWQQGDGLERFLAFRHLYGSRLEHRVQDVEELDPADIGVFDEVLCLGLYYHLRDPFRFLRTVRRVTGRRLILSGRTVRMTVFDPYAPGARSASYMTMGNRGFGKWLANVPCLMDMLRIAGFSRVDVVYDACPAGSLIASTALHAWV